MATITYLKEIPVIKRIFGILSVLLGLYGLVAGGIGIGLITLVIGVNLLLAEGAQIDLENKTYRQIKSLFGLHFGKWKPCPQFEYVTVFRTKETQRVNVVTASAAFSSQVILLNLFYDTSKHITFYKTNDKTDAFRVADHFKSALGIDILDATESEKKWL